MSNQKVYAVKKAWCPLSPTRGFVNNSNLKIHMKKAHPEYLLEQNAQPQSSVCANHTTSESDLATVQQPADSNPQSSVQVKTKLDNSKICCFYNETYSCKEKFTNMTSYISHLRKVHNKLISEKCLVFESKEGNYLSIT
jgi:hypothetical protein